MKMFPWLPDGATERKPSLHNSAKVLEPPREVAQPPATARVTQLRGRTLGGLAVVLRLT